MRPKEYIIDMDFIKTQWIKLLKKLGAMRGGKTVRFVLPQIAHYIYNSGRYYMLRNVWGVCGDRVGIARGNMGSGERPNNIDTSDASCKKQTLNKNAVGARPERRRI